MKIVTLGEWGRLQVFGTADVGRLSAPPLPGWLPVMDRYRPTRLALRTLGGQHLDYVAVWPDDRDAPDPDAETAWRIEELDGVLLAEPTEHFRCAVCGRRVNALYPETGLPFFNQFNRHRWATTCPYCAAHVDSARLHALALFVAESEGEV